MNGARRFTPPAMGLYPFLSHVFTNCGASGRFGPTIAQVQAAYSSVAWAQNSEFLSLGAYQGYQKWTVPASGLYRIVALGALGGIASLYGGGYPGRGAQVQADVELVKGEYIIIAVGQMGSAATIYGGGGGGTFVVRSSGNVPLVVAGGGGGARQSANTRTANTDASTTTDARPPSHYPGTNGCPGAGGFNSSGRASTYNGPGAGGFQAGLVGCDKYHADASAGGFGGGSGGDGIYYGSAGHGGGYSGGALYQSYGTGGAGGTGSAYAGCGGGSYATGSNISIIGAVGTGHGSVTITKV